MSPWRRSSTIPRKTNNNKIKPNYIVNARFRRRSFHEPNLVRIKADPNYLDRLNWFRRQTRFKRIKMLSSVKLPAKYVIIIYTLGNAHEKFVVWIKTVPKSLQEAKFSARLSAELFQLDHFRVKKNAHFQIRHSAQPFLWKWAIFAWEWKIISISKAQY